VETFEEREKAYQERKLQQQRDTEMMNQLLQEDQERTGPIPDYAGVAAAGGSFRPAIFFDPADSALEAAAEKLTEASKGKTARGLSLGRGGRAGRKPKKAPSASQRGGAGGNKRQRTVPADEDDDGAGGAGEVVAFEDGEAMEDPDYDEDVLPWPEPPQIQQRPSWRCLSSSLSHLLI